MTHWMRVELRRIALLTPLALFCLWIGAPLGLVLAGIALAVAVNAWNDRRTR